MELPITNITIFAQSTFQVCLRNFYKSTIINWKIMRTASKLAQVFHIFKIQSNQILSPTHTGIYRGRHLHDNSVRHFGGGNTRC